MEQWLKVRPTCIYCYNEFQFYCMLLASDFVLACITVYKYGRGFDPHIILIAMCQIKLIFLNIAQSVGAVEYTDCFSAEG